MDKLLIIHNCAPQMPTTIYIYQYEKIVLSATITTFVVFKKKRADSEMHLKRNFVVPKKVFNSFPKCFSENEVIIFTSVN